MYITYYLYLYIFILDPENWLDDDLARLKDPKLFNQNMRPEETPDWEMFTPRKVYSYRTHAPEIGMMNPVKDGLNHVLGQTMSIINREARKVLHRTLEFKRLNHGYMRYHPKYGAQYMLDLLMKYHRHVGYNRRRMTVHVRHHAYLQVCECSWGILLHYCFICSREFFVVENKWNLLLSAKLMSEKIVFFFYKCSLLL